MSNNKFKVLFASIAATFMLTVRSCSDSIGSFIKKTPLPKNPITAVPKLKNTTGISPLSKVFKRNPGVPLKHLTASDTPLLAYVLKQKKKLFTNEHLHSSFLKGKNLSKYAQVSTQKREILENVNNPKIVSLFPSDDKQYRSIYGRNPSVTAQTQVKTFQRKLSDSSNSLQIGRGLDDESLIFKAIEDADSSPIIILAHSEDNGRLIVFPNGHRMKIEELHQKCIEKLKRCLVLTCHSDDFGINENISAINALDLWLAMSKEATTKKGSISVENLINIARRERNNQKNREKILISGTFIMSVPPVGYIYWQISLQDNGNQSDGNFPNAAS